MSAKFKVKHYYSCRLSDFGDDGIFLFRLAARTEDSVTLHGQDGVKKTFPVFIAPNGAEALRPHGSCPLSPVLIAR